MREVPIITHPLSKCNTIILATTNRTNKVATEASGNRRTKYKNSGQVALIKMKIHHKLSSTDAFFYF